jgi:hypothetical protein
MRLLFILLVLLSPIANAATYYVSPAGVDTNTGTITAPFKTINKGVAKVVAGDTLLVRGGTYYETVSVRASGTSSAPIIVKAYSGELPIIDGQNVRPGRWGALLESYGNYTIFDGFEVKNSIGFGMILRAKYGTIRNCNVHHNYDMNIFLQGDYSVGEYNRSWQSNQAVFSIGLEGWGASFSAARDTTNGITDGAVMRGNIIYYNWGEGISTFEANGTLMEDNISYDNWAVNFYISDATNVIAQRNIVYDTSYSDLYPKGGSGVPLIYPCNNATATNKCRGRATGLSLSNETTKLPLKNITVINNLVYGAAMAMWTQDNAGMPVTNVLIANNTFVNSPGTLNFGAAPYSNVRFVNNIVHQDNLAIQPIGNLPVGISVSNNLYNRGSAIGTGAVIGDPQFARTGSTGAGQLTGAWFKVASTSPAKDKGTLLAEVSSDFIKTPRVVPYDIGAYEVIAATVPVPPPVPVDTANLAFGKPVTVSSIQSTGYEGKYLTDGVLTSRWSSLAADPQWATIDLGKIYNLTKIKLEWETASAKAYKIQTSIDTINWVDLYSTATSPGGTENITVNGAGRYVRIAGTQRNTGWGYSLWEVSIYGTLYPCN